MRWSIEAQVKLPLVSYLSLQMSRSKSVNKVSLKPRKLLWMSREWRAMGIEMK